MSKYTTQVRYLTESGFDLDLKSYPLFDETYREHLNDKILSHYMFYEIGCETPEMFKIYLNNRLNEIMPYYNQLYKSEKIKFEPLQNVDKTIIMDRDVIGKVKNIQDITDSKNSTDKTEASSTTNSTIYSSGNRDENINTNDLSVNSDTPQDLIAFRELQGDKWASSASRSEAEDAKRIEYQDNSTTKSDTQSNSETTSKEESKNNLVGNQDNNTAEDYTQKIKGKSEGETFSEMLIKYRQTFLNIDMQIINELQDLFMMIW